MVKSMVFLTGEVYGVSHRCDRMTNERNDNHSTNQPNNTDCSSVYRGREVEEESGKSHRR